ncbi:hypothetical protein PIROE2DRAFT_17587 [Piromyces sp. E2]|nr:hypothetical protein PIROE2DRAFT_17587 [Piromyces sp. E2]|eukprot:OUM57435.1 hypothetical protein PIROE2DRAFT_17587 [Piromyces sp. E2]
MKGLGTNEKELISILGGYPPLHMNQIINEYQRKYGHRLYEEVSKETSGNFKKLCCALCVPIIEYDVDCIHKAIDGVGTDLNTLIEILVGRTNSDIRALSLEYKKKYEKDIIEEIKDETSGCTKQIFKALLQGDRDESLNPGDVQGDTEALYKAGEKRLGTNESVFIEILCKRSDNHLRQVFECYQQKYGHSFDKAISKEFSGNPEKILLKLVANIRNKAEFIATRFEKSMKGMGTEDDKLIRLVVRHRAPYIIEPIKDAYKKLYNKSLADRIKGDTSGDYRKLLLECIHENN